MADVPVSIYYASKTRRDASPSIPSNSEDDPQSPVNPPGSGSAVPLEHNSTLNKQGGSEILDEFYHLTLSQVGKVDDLPAGFTGKHSDLILDDGTNPHKTNKADVGLGNVDNTSDLNKPISNATQTALNQKANSTDLAEVAISGDYEDLINTPEPFFDLDFTWEFTGDKTYPFPSSFTLIRINYVALYGILLPKDNLAYTVNTNLNQLILGSMYTPANGDKLLISARLINS